MQFGTNFVGQNWVDIALVTDPGTIKGGEELGYSQKMRVK